MSVAISWAKKVQLAECDISVDFPKSSHIYIYIYIYIIFIYLYLHICISYNTGKSAWPDIYARCPRASAYTSGKARVPVL